ncbi:MAG: hypothetical protein WKF83_13075 [Nocardioidaceae bacterium]
MSGTTVQQDRYPNKRVYEPTPAGMAALGEWLDAEPKKQHRRGQSLIVLETFLGAYMNPDRLADQLQEHRAQAETMACRAVSGGRPPRCDGPHCVAPLRRATASRHRPRFGAVRRAAGRGDDRVDRGGPGTSGRPANVRLTLRRANAADRLPIGAMLGHGQ